MIYAYADGSCRGNGNKTNEGGFGVVAVENDKIIMAYQKNCKCTTNNREELKAIIYALQEYGKKQELTIYSDSQYCVKTFTEWMYGWKSKGWIKSDKKPPENLDLIQLYDSLIDLGFRATLLHVKGHDGNKYNEIADKLATFKMSVSEVEV